MEKDMTTGSPARILIAFSLPMLLGNLFQQLYNMVDIIVVGNFVGAPALAAVGASTSIVMLLLCVAIGLSIGCSVLVSQYYGAGDQVKMRQSVYVSLLFIMAVGLLMSVLGACFSGAILRLTRVPAEIFGDARTYLLIYAVGGVFLFAYNALAAMCRAIGDSKTPLYFLIITSLMNIAGDLILVISFGWGVAGVAWATTISQAVSALACGVYVYYKVPALRLSSKDCVFDGAMLKDLVVYAIPSTIQQCIVSFSTVAVQGLVNTFGTNTIAGYTAACKIDQFAIQPLLSLNSAMTSFTAQNMGADKKERVHAGLKVTLALMTGISVVISILVFFFGKELIGLFVDSQSVPEVIATGVSYIAVVSMCYFLLGWQFSFASVLRGAGDMSWFLSGSLLNFGARLVFAYAMAASIGFLSIVWSIPIGWVLCIVFFALRYKNGGWQNKVKIKKPETEQ
ncbi:MAG: MATE family efflux transporter [Eubacteriaceae bacterium]|nr:MATE family efflux transporter [Eubacteriaceae bacterium]